MLCGRLPWCPVAAQGFVDQRLHRLCPGSRPAPSSGPACRPPESWRACGICRPGQRRQDDQVAPSPGRRRGRRLAACRSPWPGPGWPASSPPGRAGCRPGPGPPRMDVDDQRRAGRSRRCRRCPPAFRRDARGGGGGHGAHARGGRAVDHVDRRDLRFRLEVCAADLGHLLGHIRRDLGLRGDGVAEEMVAARLDRRFRERLISFHKTLFDWNS